MEIKVDDRDFLILISIRIMKGFFFSQGSSVINVFVFQKKEQIIEKGFVSFVILGIHCQLLSVTVHFYCDLNEMLKGQWR